MIPLHARGFLPPVLAALVLVSAAAAQQTPAVPYRLALTATDAVFDSERARLYVTSLARRELQVIDLETGLAIQSFSFDLDPESLAMSPDGSQLFVALLTQPHSYYWDDGAHSGYIARFDLDSLEKTAEFRISEDPFDLVATSDGHLVVPSGSGQWTYIRVFDAATGGETGAAGIRQRSRITLHPSEKHLYTATTDSSPSDILRYDLLAGGRIQQRWDSIYHGDHRMSGNVWASPLGDIVITRGGDAFTAGGSSRNEDMIFVRSLAPSVIEALAYDVAHNTIVTGEANAVRFYNLSSLEMFAELPLEGTPGFVGIVGDTVYALLPGEIVVVEHPAPDGASNTPPTLRVSISPSTDATTDSDITYDASASSDAEDPPGALLFRFDLRDDGIWDTDFSPDPRLVHRYSTAGTKLVRVQIMDSLGLTSELLLQHDVAFADDPGAPGEAHPGFELPFAVSDAVFDPARSMLYVSSRERRGVYFVSLETGHIVRSFAFELEPESLAMTPDRSKLYAALLTRPHSPYWFDEDGHEGEIARFDLARQVKDSQIRISEDPGDLVTTDDGTLVVASGSGQWTYLRAYDAETGVETGSFHNVREGARLALHPTQPIVYLAEYEIERFDILYDGRLERRWASRDGSWNAWLDPSGGRLFARSGQVLSAGGSSQANDLVPIGQLDSASLLSDFHVDSARLTGFSVESGAVKAYNLQSYLPFADVHLREEVERVTANATTVYGLASLENRTLILTAPHPAPQGGSNTAPEARLSLSPPAGGTTLDSLTLDASQSFDAEDPSAELRYRWDLDDDGEWDTGFGPEATRSERYLTAGTKTVRVQVVDSMGLTAQAMIQFDVAFAEDPGVPGDEHPRFELPFVISDVLFDAGRGRLYATSAEKKRLYVVDLHSGFVIRQFEFDLVPESLALGPDRRELFVALLTQPHSYYWFDGDHEGYIARFDLTSLRKVAQFRIAEDPGDLVVTPDGTLVVASGSGQWTYLRAFDGATGAETGSLSGVRQGARLALQPDGVTVYVGEAYDVTRVEVQPDGALEYRWAAGWGGSRLWGSPSGDRLVTANGSVLTAGAPARDDDLVLVGDIAQGAVVDVVFDPGRRTLFAVSSSLVQPHNLESLLPFGSVDFGQPVARIGSIAETVYGLAVEGSHTLLLVAAHPAPEGGRNTPPEASLDITPASGGTTLSDFVLDASASRDAEDPPEDLRFRWDLDDDGEWDTDFSAARTRTARYGTAGTRRIRVQVRDSLGLVSERRVSFDVAFEPDPGRPGGEHPRFELPFAVSDAVFDVERSLLYATSREAKSLFIVDLTTGFVIREFDFDLEPESLTMSPDGSGLFVALLTRPHSAYWFDEDGHEGYIAHFDLGLQVKDLQYRIEADPGDILVTSDGLLVVASGSGQWTAIRSYDAVTGKEKGSAGPIYHGARIALHPSERIVYAADRGLSPSDIERYDILADDSLVRRWDSPYHGTHRMGGDVWVTPSGETLVTRGGDLFTAGGATRSQDMIYLGAFSPGRVDALSFHPEHAQVYSFEEEGVCTYPSRYYPCIRNVVIRDLRDFGALQRFPVGGPVRFLARIGRSIFLLGASDGASTPLEVISLNAAPVADPGVGAAHECRLGGAEVLLDASASSDPDSTPGSHDDIVDFEWLLAHGTPAEQSLGHGERLTATLPLGSNVVTLRVTDAAGASAVATVVHDVVDTRPPTLELGVAPDILWPPNHKLVPVEVYAAATDACGAAEIRLSAVESSAGDPEDDVEGAELGTADTSLRLRARRAGSKGERTYTLVYTAHDEAGHATARQVQVRVPHDVRFLR